MRLMTGTHVNLYGDQAYVIQLRTGFSYLFNETVYDILKIVESDPGITAEGLCGRMLEIYSVDDRDSFRADIMACVTDLVSKKIIDDEAPRNTEPSLTPEDHINRICIENHILQSVTIELTYRCNERCAHCYVADTEKDAVREMTTEEVFGLMDQLKAMDVLNVTFTGGEVALRKDLADILRYADKSGFAVSVFTNGIGLSDEMLDEIALLHPRSVSFSLYSGIPEEHEAITKIPGSFDRTLYAMMRLKCAGVMVNVKTPVLRTALNGFEKLHRMCGQLGFSHQVSFHICSTNKGCVSPTLLRVGDRETYKRLMRICSGDTFVPVPPKGADEPVCGAGCCCLSVDPYGNVFPCNGYAVKLGNIRETDIRTIWNSDRMKQFADFKFSSLRRECRECRYSNDCLYCPGAMLAETGDIREPVPETCLIAQAAWEVRNEGLPASAGAQTQ